MHQKEKYSYNLDEYGFRHEIEKMFGTYQLEKIHEIEDCDFGILDMETDQTTYLHKKFYEKVEETNFLNDYKKIYKIKLKIIQNPTF